MKRAFALEPFSRDHNDGLHLARTLKEERPAAPALAREAWEGELADHFAEEERLLGPLAGEDSARMHEEHRLIEQLIEELPSSCLALGKALEDHIRWEERVLFPAIESRITPDEEANLAQEALKMEHRRWETCPSRAEIVQRRLARLQSKY
ncbi:MAG: hypothetical protein JNM28_12920 [Armatimonadetes bacterium]|jgi:hypothetical protein|nr:hypothetical protein [Armatimonadota bacterium]